jgi:hypothetical protein
MAGGSTAVDAARVALTASRVVGELLGRIDAKRRPTASTQRIVVERLEGSQVAIGCCVPGQGGTGGAA